MATSKTGGAFGFLKKSIGSVTYSTIKDTNGKRIQVARSKPTEVANPNTVAQILQRMKVKPAARFYKAFEEVLNNAFEGVTYGAASRREFMRLAMSQTGPYIPKGATRFIPAKYPVSRGSVANPGALAYTKCTSLSMKVYSKSGFAYRIVSADVDAGWDDGSYGYPQAALDAAFGRDVQFTFIVVTQTNDGSFVPHYGRVLSNEIAFGNNNNWFFNLGGATVSIEGDDNSAMICFYSGDVDTNTSTADVIAAFEGVVAAAVIVSYKDGDTWLRSVSDMVISPALELNLYGADAQALAIESYQSDASVNNLNSAWYLNLANGQQYPGNLALLTNTFDFSVEQEGETVTVQRDLTFPYGSLINEQGSIVRQVFADASGNMIFNVNGTYTTVQNPEEAEGTKIKWSDINLQSSIYGATVVTWKEAYQLQISA